MKLKVIDKRLELKGVFSLVLEKPKGFNFYPGQYLDVGNTRAFTISSSPTEDFLGITFKKGVSVFKKYMENLKSGDNITTSHPAGTFTLDESSPAVFIAGGIGITPFRSIIKSVVDQKLSTPVTLIYSNSDDNFLFKEDLDLWVKQIPNLQIIYHSSSQNGRLNKATFQTLLPNYHLPTTIYYLAGSPQMVDNLEAILLELGVDSTNIRTDRFDGY